MKYKNVMKKNTPKIYYVAPATTILHINTEMPLTLSIGDGTTPTTGPVVPADDGGGRAKPFDGWNIDNSEGRGPWE